jgi:DNA-binding response OmpR family regulator
MKRVLIIDDDASVLETLAEMLKDHYQPLTASSGKEGIQIAVRDAPEVILLDVNMPEMDGWEVCQRLREQPATRSIPVVMLTTAADLDDRVKGFDLGADDYVTKPFQVRELLARVRARLRRVEKDKLDQGEISLGNLKLDPKSSRVWVDGELIKLTGMEFDLIRYFLERPNQIIARTKLLGDLWPDAVVTDRTVDTHIANLRKKIRRFNYPLNTIYGAGYILAAPKEKEEGEAAS